VGSSDCLSILGLFRNSSIVSDGVYNLFVQNWKKELEKHREKLLSGNESSSKKRQVMPLVYCYS
jgi:hypothetical protein